MGDGEPPGEHLADDVGQRAGALVGGQVVVRVAEHAQRPAAQRRRVDRGDLPGGAAQVDQPAVRAQRAQGRGGGDAEQRVDDQVHRAVDAHPAGELGDVVGVAERHRDVGAQREGPLAGPPAGRGDDPPGTRGPGELDGGLPDHAPGAQHQNPLPRRQAAAEGQRHPGRDGREPEGGDQDRVRARRQRDDVVRGHRGDRAHAAVAGLHARARREPDRGALRQVGRPVQHEAHPLHAGDVRRRRHPEVRRAARAQAVQRDDRCRRHGDQHLPLAPGRLGALARHGGRAGRLDQSGTHQVSEVHGSGATERLCRSTDRKMSFATGWRSSSASCPISPAVRRAARTRAAAAAAGRGRPAPRRTPPPR